MPARSSAVAATETENEYERQRNQRIARNRAQLKALRVPELATAVGPGNAAHKQPAAVKPKKANRKRSAPTEPIRRSTRQRREVNYQEDAAPLLTLVGTPIAEAKPAEYRPVSDPEDIVQPSVNPSEGTRDRYGRLVFDDHPEFLPSMTPRQVIQAGSFGGIYFNPRGGRPGIISPGGIDIDPGEFPEDWFEGLPDEAYKGRRYDVARNKYGVKAGQSQADWERSGWITAQDPRGWFQWYCRFYQGRRTADDARQISRWTGVAGEKGRWKRALVNKVVAANKHWNDASVSPVIRQSLLHWAYELTEADFDRMRQS